MQPGKDSHQIERARNLRDLGCLGDPERWGGQENLSFVVPTQASAYSPQIVRAQTADLIARAWDMFVAWEITGNAPNDNIDYQGLEVTIGVGQASWTHILDLRGNALGIQPTVGPPTMIAPAVFWQLGPGNGGIQRGAISLRVPIPAAVINARAILAMSAPQNHIPPHTVTQRTFVSIAPRALMI